MKNLVFDLFFFVGLLYSGDGGFEFEHIGKYLRLNHKNFVTQFESKYEIFFVRDLITLIFVDHVIDESKLNQKEGELIFREILLLRNKIEMQILNEPEKAVFALAFLSEYEKIINERGFYLSRKSSCQVIVESAVVGTGAVAGAVAGGAIGGHHASQVAGDVAEATCEAIGSAWESAWSGTENNNGGGSVSGGYQHKPSFPEHMVPPGSGMVEPIRAIKNCPMCGSNIQDLRKREIFNSLYK